MKRTTLLAGALACLSVSFFSCSNGGGKSGADSTSTGTAKAAIPLDSTTGLNYHHGGGQRVPMGDIQPCLDAYEKIMATYGITVDSPSTPITKCPPMTYRITLTEGLTYVTFRNWLDSIANAIDSTGHGTNVWLKIQPGIQTQQFVSSNGLPPARTGRISFFIVPALIDSTKTINGGTPPDGYEVGGLNP